MLAADKLQLQSALKQQATALKEKEFNLHHSNLMTVGTQAAVLAGLDITMFIEFSPPSNAEWPEPYRHIAFYLKIVYYGVIVTAFCANMIVVSHTTALSVLGAGMALRGPDGSMMTATDGLYEERNSVFETFGFGLACTVGSVLLSVWLLLPWQSAAVCWVVALTTCRTIYVNYVRVRRRFDFDESETVDFRDIMEGPANLRLPKQQPRRPPSSSSSIHQQQQLQKQQEPPKKQDRLWRKCNSGSSLPIVNGGGDHEQLRPRGAKDWEEDYHDLELQEKLISNRQDEIKRRKKAGDSPRTENIQMV